MLKWTEFKTAYRLAKLGTLSATANDLGIHRSTVMRQIDTLERHLGVRLFQRNDRGYIPTDAGIELMRIGEVTDAQFSQFAQKARSKEDVLEGQIKLTCVSELSPLILPAIAQLQSLYPKVRVEVLGDTRKYDLQYGEADLAIRTGEKPDTLDNIVIPFKDIELRLCAHENYVQRFGMPSNQNFHQHNFIALNERLPQLSWNEWIYENVPIDKIVLTSSTQQVLTHALLQGVGISIATKGAIASSDMLHEIQIGQNWRVNTWILVHRDIIPNPKVRRFIDILKEDDTDIIQF